MFFLSIRRPPRSTLLTHSFPTRRSSDLVAEPASVGADRVVNAIAAHHLYQEDLIVIDFGTATTFDVIDYHGAYKGGIIAPGINLSLDALVAAAATLPKIAIATPENRSVIGRTTEAQMHIGAFWGCVAVREGLGIGRAACRE